MIRWVEKLCSGAEIWWTRPDDPECNVMALTHADAEQIARYMERARGLPKAEFPQGGRVISWAKEAE